MSGLKKHGDVHGHVHHHMRSLVRQEIRHVGTEPLVKVKVPKLQHCHATIEAVRFVSE